MFTPKEAKARIPIVLKRIALQAIDCAIALDTYPINSREVESRVMALQGYLGHLVKLCFTVWREPKKAPFKTEDANIPQASRDHTLS